MTYQNYHKTRLSNGITVVSEYIPAVRSISLGVWIKSGTRYEEKEKKGVAHFLEHMMFKGTQKRTPRQIARSLESLGGNINAFTSKEQTCFYVEILDEHLKKAINVLADILCYSILTEREIEKERGIILDEIKSVEETPDEMIQDYFVEKLFPDHGLGFPILGTAETVEKLQREDLIAFYRRHYRNQNIIIAAAGNVHHQELINLCDKKFIFLNGSHRQPLQNPQLINNGEYVFKNSVQQAHLCMGVSGFSFDHPRRYDLLVLNTILGSGMSSRLFQNIRERHGLAYGIYSFIDFFFDNGVFGMYLGTDKKNLSRAIKLLEREVVKLWQKPVSKRELQEAKSQLKGNLVLGLENTAQRMNRLAMLEMYLQNFHSIDAVIEQIENVSQESLLETARLLLDGDRLLRVILMPQN